MRLAIHEGARGFAFTAPNPNVGCVILDSQGRFLSKGHHERYGEAHAEINALKGLSESDLRGAQVFVTLEPCAHEGRTGSCAKRLATLPLARVIYGLRDPFPQVDGKGIKILNDAKIFCRSFHEFTGTDELQNSLEELCEIFLWNVRHQLPFVTLKIASSLDGRMAMANGDSKWITGPESRAEVHRLRAAHDAVLIGSGTAMADNPHLDIRLPDFKKENKVVIWDRSDQLRDRRGEFQFSKLRPSENVFWSKAQDPASLLRDLMAQKIRSVLIEGGAKVAGAFLNAGLVNRLQLFQAPVLMGSKTRAWSEGFALESMLDRQRLDGVKHQVFGPDLLISGRLRDPKSGAHFRAM